MEHRGPKSRFQQIQKKCETEDDMQRDTNVRSSIIVVQQNSQIHQIANPIDTISAHGTLHHQNNLNHFNRPPLKTFEIFIELISVTVYIYTWYHFIVQYGKLPDRVSVNFDIDSSYDTINKEYFAFLLLGDTVFYLLMSILQLLTHKFKYLVEINKSNNQKVFSATRYFIASYKLLTLVVLLYLTVAVFNIIGNEWSPYTLYLSALFTGPYLVFGWLYYKLMNRIADNPFS